MKALNIFLVVYSFVAVASAEEPRQTQRPAPKGAQTSPLERAQAKAETATTMADYTEIVRLCEQAQRQPLSPTSTQFAAQLAAWALNRRGEAYAERAAVLIIEGKQEQAAKLDNQALADFDTAVKTDPKRWKAWHNRGVLLAAHGKWKTAVADFSRAVEINPDHADSWFNRAEIYYDKGRFDLAAADYSEALRLKPKDVAALTARGHAYFQMHKFREAHADYDATVSLASDDAHAYTNRGDAAAKLGRWQDAAADYREAVALDPKLGRAYQSAAWLMATCPDDAVRNPALAIQAAQKAIDLEGAADAKFRDTLAAAYASAGQFNEARLEIARAIELAPAEEAETLKVRRAMYEKQQAYRQAPMGPQRDTARQR